MMAGGTNQHNTIAANIVVDPMRHLRRTRCRHCSSDTKIQTACGQSYDTDAQVDCGPFGPDATASSKPTIVFEVLSATTRDPDLGIRLPADQATPSISQIVYLAPNLTHVMIWTRTADGWTESVRVRAEESIALDGLAIKMSVAALYEGAFAAP
jgi:Uma2 family endonuclease